MGQWASTDAIIMYCSKLLQLFEELVEIGTIEHPPKKVKFSNKVTKSRIFTK